MRNTFEAGRSDHELRVFEIQKRGHAATLWLNRPEKRNALGPAFWNELPAAMGELERDADVRAVVLAGRGRDFTVGLDLKAMSGGLFDGERSRFSLLDEIARLRGRSPPWRAARSR